MTVRAQAVKQAKTTPSPPFTRNQLPAEFTAHCTEAERVEVETWWQELPDPVFGQLSQLLDPRHRSCAHTVDPHGQWQAVPLRTMDLRSFDPIDDNDAFFLHAMQDFQGKVREQQAGLILDIRITGICQAAASAQRCLRTRRISSTFRCSDHNPSCVFTVFMRQHGYREVMFLEYLPKGRAIVICLPGPRDDP